MSTPSAPSWNALRMCTGSMRPEQLVLIGTMFGGYFIREVPARSAPL